MYDAFQDTASSQWSVRKASSLKNCSKIQTFQNVSVQFRCVLSTGHQQSNDQLKLVVQSSEALSGQLKSHLAPVWLGFNWKALESD